jgi:CheY-like chemotaxis protein
MDGHEAARQIRRLPLARRPLIVALTGWGNERDRLRSHESGIDAHLLKPTDVESLSRILARLDAPSTARDEQEAKPTA